MGHERMTGFENRISTSKCQLLSGYGNPTTNINGRNAIGFDRILVDPETCDLHTLLDKIDRHPMQQQADAYSPIRSQYKATVIAHQRAGDIR
ncbi:hypothetical protein OY671_013088, partial [Metschnikowia pulcherrima]